MALRRIEVIDLTDGRGRRRYEELRNDPQIQVLTSNDFFAMEGDRENGFAAAIYRVLEFRDRSAGAPVGGCDLISLGQDVSTAPVC